jgi:hypothetical protein
MDILNSTSINYYAYGTNSSTEYSTINFDNLSRNAVSTDHCNPAHMEEFNCSVQQFLQYSRYNNYLFFYLKNRSFQIHFRGLQQQTLGIAITVSFYFYKKNVMFHVILYFMIL